LPLISLRIVHWMLLVMLTLFYSALILT